MFLVMVIGDTKLLAAYPFEIQPVPLAERDIRLEFFDIIESLKLGNITSINLEQSLLLPIFLTQGCLIHYSATPIDESTTNAVCCSTNANESNRTSTK